MKTKRQVSMLALGLALAFSAGASPAAADDAAKVSVTLKDHRFSPAEPTAPAGQRIVIEVTNLDVTPSEFESKALRVEKVVARRRQGHNSSPPSDAGPLSFLRRLSRGHDRRISGGQMSALVVRMDMV